MKLKIRNAVWAVALAIAVTGFVTPKFAIAQHQIASSGILLFNGTGTTNGSNGDVAALENIITNNLGLDYDTVDSTGLDNMTVASLEAYKLLIIPGGNSITIGNNLKASTTANIKTAVRNGGLHYLGVCAGAFLASYAGTSGYNDINLLNGIWFDKYPDSKYNDCLAISRPQGQTTLDIYWQDGPSLTTLGGTWGTIVAKYPNGDPAIIQGFAGNGWTLLQGVHPEAPADWISPTCGSTSADHAYSATLISAALNGTVLPHY